MLPRLEVSFASRAGWLARIAQGQTNKGKIEHSIYSN
jgi:hypothetical protein